MGEKTQNQIGRINPVSFTPTHSGVLQRACACGKHTSGGECAECIAKTRSLQRKNRKPGPETRNGDNLPPIVHEVLHSPGQPLDSATRNLFEPRFGHDFSQVRVHTDAKAAESAWAVNALAYTVGQTMVFGDGEYNPTTATGRKLLAHELTHVLQQDRADPTSELQLGGVNSPYEHTAERAAQGLTNAPQRIGHVTLQRQPYPEETGPRNVGPPVQELPLPPRCSIVWRDGRWSWKCEGLPGIGSTPEVPLDPRDIPARLRELIPPGPGGNAPAGERSFPLPPSPGSELPPNWLDEVCRRSPMSSLCIPLGGTPTPNQPGAPRTSSRPIGIFFTFDVLFQHDQPSPSTSSSSGGLTADGVRTIDLIIFLMTSDPTIQVRLIGHASSEGDAAHNMALSRRRAQLVYQKLDDAGLSARVMDPIRPDARQAGCTRVDFGVWACGENEATQGEARPEERKVAVTFLRNPPLPSGPLRLTPPQIGRPRLE